MGKSDGGMRKQGAEGSEGETGGKDHFQVVNSMVLSMPTDTEDFDHDHRGKQRRGAGEQAVVPAARHRVTPKDAVLIPASEMLVTQCSGLPNEESLPFCPHHKAGPVAASPAPRQ